MRCGNKLVSVGDTKIEVILKCGEPFFRNTIALKSIKVKTPHVSLEGQITSATTEEIEQWAYVQGPGTLLKILTFQGSQLVNIEHGDRVADGRDRSSTLIVSPGDTQAQILQRYGEPLYQEVLGFDSEKFESKISASDEKVVTTTNEKLERWTYHLGPNTFLKILTFKGGKLIKVEQGERR